MCFDTQSRDQSIPLGPEKKSRHNSSAGNDMLDTEELIRMSQVSIHKTEELV